MYLQLRCFGRMWSIRCCWEPYLPSECLLQSGMHLFLYRPPSTYGGTSWSSASVVPLKVSIILYCTMCKFLLLIYTSLRVLWCWMPVVLQSSWTIFLWRQPGDSTPSTYWLLRGIYHPQLHLWIIELMCFTGMGSIQWQSCLQCLSTWINFSRDPDAQ